MTSNTTPNMNTDFSFVNIASAAVQPLKAAEQEIRTAFEGSVPLASEILQNAPVPLEQTINKAKEMAAVPERDIPKETLDKRNTETDETLADRTLAAAAKQNDECGVPSACASTGQEKGSSPISPQNMGKPFVGEPQEKFQDTKQAEQTAEPAGNANKTAEISSDSQTPVQDTSKTDGMAEIGAQTLETVSAESDIAPADNFRELEIPQELFDVLNTCDFDLFGPQNLSLEEMRELNAKLDSLIESPLGSESDAESLQGMLKARLMEKSVQLANSIASREHLHERLEDISNLIKADTDKEQSTEILANLALIWQNGKKQTELITNLAKGDPAAVRDLADAAGTRTGIIGTDLENFEKVLIDASACVLERFLPDTFTAERDAHESGMHSLRETLAWISRFSLHAGERPEVMLDKLMQGLSWASSASHQKTLLNIFSSAMEKALEAEAKNELDAAACGEILRYADMVFQGAYPEYADTALELKKLLLPKHEEEINIQHQCLVASRHLISLLDSGQGSSGKTRSGALDRTLHDMESISARSFLLKPSTVKALMQNADIPDFNYHIAHVALLQKKAVEAGLLPLTNPADIELINADNWYTELGLDKDTALYAKNLEEQVQNNAALTALLQACDFFVQGFQGANDVSKAVDRLNKHSALTATPRAGRREHHLYESSPAYLARLALDRSIVNLTGLLRPEERFAENDSAMTLNGAAIDEAMVKQTNSLYENLLDKESLQELRETADKTAAMQQKLLNNVQEVKIHADMMSRLADSSRELFNLRIKQTKQNQEFSAMERDKALIRTTWPHRRAERTEVCRTVLAIEKRCKELEPKLPPTELAAELAKDREIRELLAELRGINPHTLARSRHFSGKSPDLETVVQLMLPRARALHFFEGKTTGVTSAKTHAEEALRQIRITRSDLKREQKKIDSILKSLNKQLGKDNIRQIQQTITAALYKVFAESQQPLAAFSVNDEQTRQAVYEQLQTWGLPVKSSFTNVLIKLTLASATRENGMLDMKKLKRDALNGKLEFVGKETMKTEMQNRGLPKHEFAAMPERREAYKRQQEFINSTLLSDERRRAEGVRMLMREASKPGSGFVYDRARGMIVDTGKVFSPFSSPTQLVNKINIGHPLSARLRFMMNDSLTVCNTGGGSYQVIIKGGLASSIGSTVKIGIPGSALSASFGINAGNKNEQGLAVSFADAGSCEKFLNTFMHPGKEGFSDLSALTSATQIRFVDGNTVSGDLSLGLMASLFQESLGDLAVTGSASAALGLAGDLTQQTEQNSTGETTTFSMRGRISLSASVSAGTVKDTTMSSTKKMAKSKGIMLDITQRFKLSTGPKGLLPSSCAETEYPAAALKGGIGQSIARRLLLPSAVRRQMEENPAFSAALENLINTMPPTASLTVHRALKPAVLEDVRKLFVQARNAVSDAERENALKKAHHLLASLDSYTPTRLSVKKVTPSAVSRNWSPGLMAFQYARNTTSARFQMSDPLTIPLPQAE